MLCLKFVFVVKFSKDPKESPQRFFDDVEMQMEVSLLQGVAGCCRALQGVAGCCIVLCVNVCLLCNSPKTPRGKLPAVRHRRRNANGGECVAVCCSVLHCVVVCCRVLQCVVCEIFVCGRILQRPQGKPAEVLRRRRNSNGGEGVLQCVAVCCSVLQHGAGCCIVLCVDLCLFSNSPKISIGKLSAVHRRHRNANGCEGVCMFVYVCVRVCVRVWVCMCVCV